MANSVERPLLPESSFSSLRQLATDLPPSLRLWQHKTLNIHRGVIHWDARSLAMSLPKASQQMRSIVQEQFKPSWWRGFGFGTVVSMREFDDSFQHVAKLVDVRNNGKGTWQWVVLHFPEAKSAIGVCTWTEGFLAPIYRGLLDDLKKSGFTCESHQRDMDALQKGLLRIHKVLKVASRVLPEG